MWLWALMLAAVAALAAPPAASTGLSSQSLRKLAPEDFALINKLLSGINVTLPDIKTSAVGVDISVIGLTCFGARVNDITVTTRQIDSRTYDMRPHVSGVHLRCKAQWGYYVPATKWSGSGTFSISANGVDLGAVIRVVPLDFAIIGGGPPPPPAPTGSQCLAASGCNFPCGVTPAEYAAANLLTATSRQCYYCDQYYFSDAPDWCEFRSSSLWADMCCTLNDCVGEACADDGWVASPPPPTTAPCTAIPKCTHPCGVTPTEYATELSLVTAQSGQCYECARRASSLPYR